MLNLKCEKVINSMINDDLLAIRYDYLNDKINLVKKSISKLIDKNLKNKGEVEKESYLYQYSLQYKLKLEYLLLFEDDFKNYSNEFLTDIDSDILYFNNGYKKQLNVIYKYSGTDSLKAGIFEELTEIEDVFYSSITMIKQLKVVYDFVLPLSKNNKITKKDIVFLMSLYNVIKKLDYFFKTFVKENIIDDEELKMLITAYLLEEGIEENKELAFNIIEKVVKNKETCLSINIKNIK